MTVRDQVVSYASKRGDFPLVSRRCALIILDIQKYDSEPETEEDAKGYLHSESFPRAIDHIKKLVDCFRSARDSGTSTGCEVIFVYLQSCTNDGRDVSLDYKLSGKKFSNIPRRSATVDEVFLDELKPDLTTGKGDLLVPKTSCSVFVSTNLDYLLRNLGIEQIVLTGQYTDQCIESAVRDAADLGYFVTLAEDACAATTAANHAKGLHGAQGFARIVKTAQILEEISSQLDARKNLVAAEPTDAQVLEYLVARGLDNAVYEMENYLRGSRASDAPKRETESNNGGTVSELPQTIDEATEEASSKSLILDPVVGVDKPETTTELKETKDDGGQEPSVDKEQDISNKEIEESGAKEVSAQEDTVPEEGEGKDASADDKQEDGQKDKTKRSSSLLARFTNRGKKGTETEIEKKDGKEATKEAAAIESSEQQEKQKKLLGGLFSKGKKDNKDVASSKPTGQVLGGNASKSTLSEGGGGDGSLREDDSALEVASKSSKGPSSPKQVKRKFGFFGKSTREVKTSNEVEEGKAPDQAANDEKSGAAETQPAEVKTGDEAEVTEKDVVPSVDEKSAEHEGEKLSQEEKTDGDNPPSNEVLPEDEMKIASDKSKIPGNGDLGEKSASIQKEKTNDGSETADGESRAEKVSHSGRHEKSVSKRNIADEKKGHSSKSSAKNNEEKERHRTKSTEEKLRKSSSSKKHSDHRRSKDFEDLDKEGSKGSLNVDEADLAEAKNKEEKAMKSPKTKRPSVTGEQSDSKKSPKTRKPSLPDMTKELGVVYVEHGAAESESSRDPKSADQAAQVVDKTLDSNDTNATEETQPSEVKVEGEVLKNEEKVDEPDLPKNEVKVGEAEIPKDEEKVGEPELPKNEDGPFSSLADDKPVEVKEEKPNQEETVVADDKPEEVKEEKPSQEETVVADDKPVEVKAEKTNQEETVVADDKPEEVKEEKPNQEEKVVADHPPSIEAVPEGNAELQGEQSHKLKISNEAETPGNGDAPQASLDDASAVEVKGESSIQKEVAQDVPQTTDGHGSQDGETQADTVKVNNSEEEKVEQTNKKETDDGDNAVAVDSVPEPSAGPQEAQSDEKKHADEQKSSGTGDMPQVSVEEKSTEDVKETANDSTSVAVSDTPGDSVNEETTDNKSSKKSTTDEKTKQSGKSSSKSSDDRDRKTHKSKSSEEKGKKSSSSKKSSDHHKAKEGDDLDKQESKGSLNFDEADGAESKNNEEKGMKSHKTKGPSTGKQSGDLEKEQGGEQSKKSVDREDSVEAGEESREQNEDKGKKSSKTRKSSDQGKPKDGEEEPDKEHKSNRHRSRSRGAGEDKKSKKSSKDRN